MDAMMAALEGSATWRELRDHHDTQWDSQADLALLSRAGEFQTLEPFYWLFPLISEVMAAEEMVSELGGQDFSL